MNNLSGVLYSIVSDYPNTSKIVTSFQIHSELLWQTNISGIEIDSLAYCPNTQYYLFDGEGKAIGWGILEE